MLLLCSAAFGEYYEYTDKDGTVRFTDDPSMIPKDQQDLKTFESIRSEPREDQDMTGEEASPEADDAGMDADKDKATTSTSENLQKQNELNAIRIELRQEFDALQAEKNAIGPPPPRNARTVERNEYNDKVTELNRKIDEYQKRNQEFDEKVKAYKAETGNN